MFFLVFLYILLYKQIKKVNEMNINEMNITALQSEAKTILTKGYDAAGPNATIRKTLRGVVRAVCHELNETLPVVRRNTCFDTSTKLSELLKTMKIKHTVVYAQQRTGFSHWFVVISAQATVEEELIVDLTASQFGQDEFPNIVIGTAAELERKFEQQKFWKVLGTLADTKKASWIKKHNFN